ncbi:MULTISPECIES: hypothetical protein [Nostoc]|uniref:Uncharacterized protein n=1 Tax=Nostoc paludosum FACHB-159 TaxID=2692908 RepID=A0ABR8KIT3_9NOSO|nr:MULTISPECIES: hypothetical protein [Nostoc]MBD2681864.1 hypothetical protein [Nostoc sp. FACHB-857]MBD2738210.1 hypothetical protein [Nostoc paludosum FACHB-159]
MEKQKKLLLLLKSVPVTVIFMFCFLKPNTFIYAQISSSTAIPTSSPIASTSLSQVSSSTQPQINWESMNAIGTLLSGIAAIVSLVKSGNNEKELKKVKTDIMQKESGKLFSEKLEKSKKLSLANLFKFIDTLIEQTPDQTKKKSLLDLKEELEKESIDLAKRDDASKEAETWLERNREQLAYEAINDALINDSSVRKVVREEFLSQIEDYLHAIHTSLDIGNTEYLEEVVNDLVHKHVLTNSLYKKALEYVSNKAASSQNLSQIAFKEMKYYLDYLMRNIP